jgi:hypothetical protein
VGPSITSASIVRWISSFKKGSLSLPRHYRSFTGNTTSFPFYRAQRNSYLTFSHSKKNHGHRAAYLSTSTFHIKVVRSFYSTRTLLLWWLDCRVVRESSLLYFAPRKIPAIPKPTSPASSDRSTRSKTPLPIDHRYSALSTWQLYQDFGIYHPLKSIASGRQTFWCEGRVFLATPGFDTHFATGRADCLEHLNSSDKRAGSISESRIILWKKLFHQQKA